MKLLYFTNMNVNKNINILSLKIWLITMITLVSLIVFVGGLTRLTESGLSITVWEVFKGVFPPLNLQEWNNYFNDYKKIPEYKLLNTEMSLDEFKKTCDEFTNKKLFKCNQVNELTKDEFGNLILKKIDN